MSEDLRVLLERYPQDSDREWIKFLREKIDFAVRERISWETLFLTPYRRQLTEEVISFYVNINYIVFGGYPGAKRVRLRVWPAEIAGGQMPEIVMLKIRGDFTRENFSEHELLQIIYNGKIAEEMCGDLLWADIGNLILFMSEKPGDGFVDSLKKRFKEIREVSLEKDFDFTEVPYGNTKTIKGTIASMRLDAVASLGWGISRSKAATNIKSGLVSVNWKSEKNPSAKVKEKDFVALRTGTGFIIESILGKSRKGRENILLKKIY